VHLCGALTQAGAHDSAGGEWVVESG
jgi:hypothetical protein